MKIKILHIIFMIFFASIYSSTAFCWSVINHKDISEIAVNYSVLGEDYGNFAKENLGLEAGLNEIVAGCARRGDPLSVIRMIQLGAQYEDAFCWQTPDVSCFDYLGRFNHHYHNPLKNLEDAGLDDIWTGTSSLLWSQDDKQTWSWNNIRDIYYEALTSKDLTWGERRLLLAYTFLGIGHQLHLAQDKAVPDHVRNDSHVKEVIPDFFQRLSGGLFFESWAEKNRYLIRDYAAGNPIYPEIDLAEPYENIDALPVAKLIDTRTYFETGIPSASLSIGLAEFTNANFFSADTIFAAERYSNHMDHKHYFPYPRESDTNLQEFIDEGALPARRNEYGETEFVISMVSDRMQIEHFVQPTYFTRYLDPLTNLVYLRTFYLSEKCHADYAAELVPRASGYSTALIDYFFRGSIEISLPEDGLYAFIDSHVDRGNIHSVGFDRIELMARNTSFYGEALNNGSIELVIAYNTLDHDYPFENFTSMPPYSGPFYTVVPEANGRRSISDTPVKLEFDLHEVPIPLTATDLTLHVVYKGELGAETEKGVAVGFKDISEPTPVVVFNTCDNICMNASWYTAGSSSAIDIVDYNDNDVANPAYVDEDGVRHPSEWDVYPHDASDICFGFHPVAAPRTPVCSAPGNGLQDFSIPYLPAGDSHRVVILSDYELGMTSNPSQVVASFGSCPHEFPHQWHHGNFRGGRYALSAVKHKTELQDDNYLCDGQDPCYIRFLSGFTQLYGTESHNALFLINREYPANSDPSLIHCSFEDLEN